jgi:hypothetical protein
MKKRSVEKEDILLKYSMTCDICLSEFKENQLVVEDGLDTFHLICWDNKNVN